MGNDKNPETRARLLEQLKNDLAEDYIAAEYIDADECGITAGEVTVMFDSLGMESNEAFGELFFLPDENEEADTGYFECVLLISDSLENADIKALNSACTKANHTCPAGLFYVDEENGRLLFKMGVPFPNATDEDTLYEEMNTVVGTSLSIVDSSIDEFLELTED